MKETHIPNAQGDNNDFLYYPHCKHTGAFTVNVADVWDWLTDITVPPAEAPLQYFSMEVRAQSRAGASL